MKTLSIAKIFKDEFGVDYENMKYWEVINVEKFNKKIKSFNPKIQKEEFNLIKNIVRKPDSKAYLVKCGDSSFECSADHKVAIKFDKDTKDFTYMTVSQLKKIGNYFMYNNGNWEKATIQSLEKYIPILDIEVDSVHNYFANDILSHNTIFGNPETTPGGLALKFGASIRLEVRKIETVSNDGDDADANGIKSRVKCIKNKTGIPFRKGEMFFDFKNGVDFYGEYVDFAVKLDIVQKGGAWFSYNSERWQGAKNFAADLRNRPELFQEIKDKVDAILQADPSKKIDLPETEEVLKPKKGKVVEETISLADEALQGE